jgi:hypothetical protein
MLRSQIAISCVGPIQAAVMVDLRRRRPCGRGARSVPDFSSALATHPDPVRRPYLRRATTGGRIAAN